jgi:hypothetical protein
VCALLGGGCHAARSQGATIQLLPPLLCRWAKEDWGDELPAAEQSGGEDSGSASGAEQQLDGNAAAAGAGGAASAAPGAACGAGGAAAAAVPPVPLAPSGASAGQVVLKARRPQMVGCSPVHVAAKDSIITEIGHNFTITRHDGLLNLGVVFLLATNTRCGGHGVLPIAVGVPQ